MSIAIEKISDKTIILRISLEKNYEFTHAACCYKIYGLLIKLADFLITDQ